MFINTNDDNYLLSIEELCEELRISQTCAYRLLQKGELTAFKLGSWKIPAKSVKEYIKRRLSGE
jgi:excisionase family DNA binding protein